MTAISLDDLCLEDEGWKKVTKKEYPRGFYWDKKKNEITETETDLCGPFYLKDGQFFCSTATFVQGSGVVSIYATKSDCIRHETAKLNKSADEIIKKYIKDFEENRKDLKNLEKIK